MSRRDLMITAEILPGAEPTITVNGFGRINEVKAETKSKGGELVPVRLLKNKRTGEERYEYFDDTEATFEAWKDDGIQELVPYLENGSEEVQWRDAEDNETTRETMARWGEAAADYGEAVASQAGRLVTQIPKMIVGLAQVTNAGLGWISSWGGLNPNPVSNQFHEWAKDTAHLRQGLDRFDEKYLSADKKYDHLMSDGVRTTRDVIEGVTNLGAQLLIGGAVTKGAQAVNTAATTVKGVAPVAKVVAPTTLTKGQMVVEAGKKIFTGPGSHYALGMAGEAAGETHAAAIENGVDPNKAAVTAGADFLTSLILNRADVESGAISAVAGPAAGQTVKQWFLGGLMRPFKSDVAKRFMRNVAWEGGSEALDQWMHLSRLQDVGVEISQDDKVRATAQAGLYGALGGALGEVGGAIEARSELKKWRRLFAIEHQAEAVEALKRAAAGQPIATDAPGGPAVVTEKGSVLFKDGAEVHGDGTITTVNGVVTDTEGQPITVVPESTDSATVDLFRLIRESDLQVQNVPVDSLKVNDQIVQFKQDADPNTGVVEGERLQGAFNPIPAKPILVMEFADGSREVVTGRHRLDLAKQNNMKAIPANIIYEKDGWTVDAARLMDAYDNILDGKGSDQDFVDFFRNAKLDNRAIQEHPELWSRKRQKDALVVAKGASEDLYTFFMAKDDRLNLETAAAIVSGAPRQKGEQNVKIQRAVLKAVLDNGLRANDAALMTRSLAHAYSQRLEAKGIQQLDLFGEDDTVIMAMGLEAKYAQRKINEINTDLRALKTLLGKQGGNLQARDALLQKYGLESSEDIQGIQNTITKLDGEVNRWKNYFTDPVLAKQAQAYAREVLHLENPVIEVDGEITTVDDRILETAPEVESTYEDPNQEGFDFAMTNDLGVTEAQRQYDEVEARFTCSDGSKDPTTWMRAPNGQPTKLSERQWIHVRTPYFKQRFGDWENDPAKATKILDENGEPRVMYHGSPAKFTIFSSKKMGSTGTSRGKGFYFSPSKEFASGYVDKGGKLYEVFLDIRKPLAYDHRTMTRAQIAKLLDALDRKLEALNGPDMGVLMDFGDVHVEGRRNVLNQAAELLDGGNDSDVDVFSELVNITGDYNTVAAVTYEVLGYDGIIPTDTDLEVIALTPAQIKSATDNVGTYSSADDDINYSVILGEKGAANLAPEMQVMEGLVMAKQMLGNRDWAKLNAAEKDKIRLASGWEVGADGKWRFEWKDFELVSDWSKRADGTLGELLAGEGAADLFTAYPQLREINVRFETLPGGKSGYFNPRENRIAINITQIEGDSEAIRKNLTHEIQHAIQKIEGFASGGNVASEEMNHMAKLFNDAMDRKKAGEDVSSWVLDQYYHEYLLARKKAYEDYRRIAGEVEARNAATRRFGAKSYFSLEDTEGIDRRQQIIKNDNVGTYSSADDDINYSEIVEGGAQRPLSGRTKPAGTAIPASNSISLTPKDAGSVLEFANSISQSGKVEAKTFLSQLMKRLGAGDDIEKTKYFSLKNGEFSLRLSNHRAVAKTYLEKQNQAKTKLSIVIKLKDTKFRTHKDVHLQELVYFADNLTADVEIGIAKGIANLLTDGNYSGPVPDQINVSPRETLGKTSPSQGDDIIDTVLNTDNQDIKRHDNSSDDTNASRGRFDYASTMDISMYGNNGRVPVAGSPARERGVLPLSLHHVVEMYRLLTGKLPRVVANRSHGAATALGWFNNKTQDIMVRAQLFGLVDKTDVGLLHNRLVQKGYFRNEDPAWVAANKGKVNQKQSLVDFERNKSEQALAAEVDKLVEQRIKSGIHQGIGTKVMAHELWHLIDLIDGEAVNRCKERGNLIGHIASLKGHFEKVFAEIPMASNKALTDECLEFISAWQGSPDVSYFQNKPEEIYAEMGSALMLDPERVRRSAPNFYNAMLDTMARKPKVLDIWTATMDQMRLGVDGDALIARLQKTWTREAEITHRQVRDAITKPTWHMLWMDTVRVFFDRYKPLIMVVQKAQADVRAKLKADLKEGVITQSDYEASIARLDKQMLDTRYAKAMYSHQYGRSKLYLADLNEKVAKEAEKRDVNMETLATYLHLKRVIELKGRATALGIDAPTARHKLNELASQLGFVKFKQVATMANIFRSLYEQHVLSNPDVRQMFGEKIMGYLDKNKHYVTMSHTVDAESVEATARRLKGEAPAIDPLEVALQDVRSLATGGDRGGIGNVLHRLEGSFRPTVNPIGATAQTAVTLLETAQQNATIIQVVDALLANNSPDVKILGTGDSRVENARFGNVTFMRNGERVTARVPRVLADAINQRGANVPLLTLPSRFMNSAFTTNNIAFAITAYQRDLDALAINNKGLHRSPLYWLTAFNLSALIPRKGALLTSLHHSMDIGAYAAAAAQWIPPHIMKNIGNNPVGRLIFNRHTVEYWTSYGNKIARIIQNGSFEATLQDAAKARAAGNENKARELEYCVTMARRALEDGILLTMNQLRRDDYSKSNLAQLFDKYNLRYDDPGELTPMPRNLAKQIALGVAKSPWVALQAYWTSAGYINELASMTNKLAGYCAMHDQRSREGYDEAHRKEIALQAIDRAGDPDFSARGTIAGLLELFCSPFWNARREGFMRGVRAFQEHPGNWTVKAMSHAMPRFISLLISSGILSGYLRELIGDPSDEELEGTAVGEMLYTLDWLKDAYRNISPYTLETFRAVPIWMSDDRRTTVSLKIPIPEEAKFIDAAFNATWNTAVDAYSPNPARDWRSLLKVMGEQFAFDTSSTGVLFNALSSVVSPYVFGTNPYETYRNAPMYSEDEFKARWTKDGAEYMLKSAGKRIWNNSPLTLITRFRKTNEPEMREEAQTLKDIFKLPVVGPSLMRFASVDSEGREQTRRQLETIQDEANAVKRLKAREHSIFYLTGELDKIPDDVWSDTDTLKYMMNYAKEGTLTEQEEWIKSMKRIKDPTLQKRAFDIYE